VRALLDGIRLALRTIARSPMRASLTVLGILIAVAAVVAVTALGQGARDRVAGQIQSIGSNFIIVFPQASQASGARGAQGSGARLTEDDGRAILSESTSIVAVAPMLRSFAQVVSGDRNESPSVTGTTLAYFKVRGWAVDRGALWEPQDEILKSKVVVLGATVAEKLFGPEDPTDRSVRIGRYSYRVLGVLAPKGQTPFGEDQDDTVVMPIASFRARIMKTPPGFAGVLLASASAPETTDRAILQVESVLRQRHRIEQGRDPDFTIRSQKEFAEMQARIAGALTFMLVFVAAISLVVGGIGVMNIMLVSVTERTREIGVRMAIGAHTSDILTQFLVEAVALTLLGGIAGAGAGVGAITLMQALLEWPMKLSTEALEISIGASGLTGIVFGFFPALRAARLDPIEALRHE
jgi:putative ABC transport system permease protein